MRNLYMRGLYTWHGNFEVKAIEHDFGRTTYEAFGWVGKKLHTKGFPTYDEAPRHSDSYKAKTKIY
jgi:hypothetical protein